MLSFVCPVCHSPLSGAGSARLTCPRCGRNFPDREGAIDFTPNPPPDSDVQERWPLWDQLQHNFLVAATELPEHSLSVGDRLDARAFAEFSELRGNVLDIGCGPQSAPSYGVAADGHFVGIDPVRGELERSFAFVQGLGEYLPFGDHSFARVLFATSLDHVLSPVRALSEARRVLSKNGTVNIWFGEVKDGGKRQSIWRRAAHVASHPREVAGQLTARVRSESPAYMRQLDVPEGAIDMFHVIHLDRPLVSQWLDAARLTVTDVGRHEASVFLRAEPR